jgi:hypothetical protein
VLYDLLDPNLKSGTAKKRGDTQLDVKEHPQLGVYVAGLQEIPADTSTKILALIDQGAASRLSLPPPSAPPALVASTETIAPTATHCSSPTHTRPLRPIQPLDRPHD